VLHLDLVGLARSPTGRVDGDGMIRQAWVCANAHGFQLATTAGRPLIKRRFVISLRYATRKRFGSLTWTSRAGPD